MSKLVQTQEQKQKLNPRQILEANIMQIASGFLEKRILEEIESNPMLEFDEDKDLIDDESDDVDEENDFNWEDLISNPEEYGIKSNNQLDYDFTVADSMSENFISQLHDVNIEEDKIEVAEYIIGNIDDDGYLSIDPILIIDKFGIDKDSLDDLLRIIRKLDPPGIASKNIQECLATQLEVLYPNEIIAKKIINDFFDEFANHNYSKIIDKMQCSKNEFNDAISLICVLNPKPGSYFSTQVSENIIPDVVIEKNKNKWVVSTNENFLPKLRMSRGYKDILSKKNINKGDQKFIKQKIESADWFMGAVKNRYTTIKKVTESIIKHQKSYFNFENRELEPLTLKKIANDVKMDISTISRSTNGKYAQLPWGCIELKTFFSEGILKKDGSEVSNTVVKKIIKDIIDKENKNLPYKDEDIKNILLKKGYLIARRTVSKYRELLNIPISRLRREIV